VMQLLVWLRMPGDILFSIGVLMLVVFVGKLFLGRGRRQEAQVPVTAGTVSRTAR
jgi:nitric oxide reductase large subunit